MTRDDGRTAESGGQSEGLEKRLLCRGPCTGGSHHNATCHGHCSWASLRSARRTQGEFESVKPVQARLFCTRTEPRPRASACSPRPWNFSSEQSGLSMTTRGIHTGATCSYERKDRVPGHRSQLLRSRSFLRARHFCVQNTTQSANACTTGKSTADCAQPNTTGMTGACIGV